MIRLYQPIPLPLHATVWLDEPASHRLIQVMRAQVHDQMTLFNGEGGEAQAVITQLQKKRVEVKITALSSQEAESPFAIHLAQGIAKGEKMDWIIQKAVELGVNQVTPIITERCNVRLDHERSEKRQQHWQAVAISACEQCGRNRIPTISAPISLANWLPTAEADIRAILTPQTDTESPPSQHTSPQSAVLLIGPEGGFTEAEVALAKHHHFLPLTLGPRILRTETAPLVGLTLLQYCYGDLTSKSFSVK